FVHPSISQDVDESFAADLVVLDSVELSVSEDIRLKTVRFGYQRSYLLGLATSADDDVSHLCSSSSAGASGGVMCGLPRPRSLSAVSATDQAAIVRRAL